MTASLAISDLASMRFTDSAETSIEGQGRALDSRFDVFALDGKSAGSYQSLSEMKKSLPSGTYIIRCGNYSIKLSI